MSIKTPKAFSFGGKSEIKHPGAVSPGPANYKIPDEKIPSPKIGTS